MAMNINVEAADPRKELRLQNPSPSQTTLTDMPLEMMIKIFTHLGVSSAPDVFRCKTLNKVIKKVCDSKEIYEHLEIEHFFTVKFGMLLSDYRESKEKIIERCRKEKNPNLMFREAMVQYFIAGNSSGKDWIEKASEMGKSDAIFVQGMIMMAEGNHGREEALRLLNNAYRKSGGKWNISAILQKIQRVLSRGHRKTLEFHGCYMCFHVHHDLRLLSKASMHFQDKCSLIVLSVCGRLLLWPLAGYLGRNGGGISLDGVGVKIL